jgi:Protein of unknown function (DUF998)
MLREGLRGGYGPVNTDPQINETPPLTNAKRSRNAQRSNVYGLAGLLGAGAFALSLTTLQLAGTGIDWRHDYISHFTHTKLNWLFLLGTVVHGFGNLALSLGLRRSVGPGRLQTWAVLLFGMAAACFVLIVLIPIDSAGASLTWVGLTHRTVVYVAFSGQLVALFLFSVAFARDPRWRWRSRTSFALSAIAAVALAGFLVAALLNRMPGLAERLALASFLAWDFWVAFHVARLPSARCVRLE